MSQITFKQYRNIDLIIWTVLTIIFETITTIATAKWFALQPVAISITLTLVCVVMMRWGGWAAIVAVVGGFVFCIMSGATTEQYLIYCIGNLFALAALLLIRIWGKEKIRSSMARLFALALTAYIGMAVGRWLISLCFGGDLMTFTVYATTDILSLLFAVIILILLRNADGMLEDQKAYLFRLDRERKEEENTIQTDDEY